MSEVQWKNGDGETLDLYKVDEDDTLLVDGSARKISAGTLLLPGPDNVGYYSFNEEDWKKEGFSESSETEPETTPVTSEPVPAHAADTPEQASPTPPTPEQQA